MVSYIEHKLHEIGVRHNYFIAGIEERLEDDIQSSRGADGHYNIVLAERKFCLFLTIVRYFLTDKFIAAICHVPVHPLGIRRDYFGKFFFEFPWWLCNRIAEGKIEYILWPILFFQFLPFLEHGPDPGGGFH